MIYHLSSLLIPHYSCFNLFHYTSFRAISALLTALFLSFLFGNWFIKKSNDIFQSGPREHTPDSHKKKKNIPTMGGIFILSTVIISCLLWGNLTKLNLWIGILSLVLFGIIGLIDDLNKINKKKGISAKAKFILQLFFALIIVSLMLYSGISTSISFPFFKNFQPDLGLFFILWAIFIIVGCSNAVNLTDGLDGLAIGSLISNFVTFSIIAFLAGHIKLASYLNIPFTGSSELVILGSALIGSSFGFLWYNSYPAQIFMGDVGSLSLGACLASIALMTKQEILLLISGGLFVLETLSVIIQVLSFKFTGKRMFKMAPIHHHFELIGWPESKITIRFCIISIILSLLALITLKIR